MVFQRKSLINFGIFLMVLLPSGYQCCKTVEELDQCVYDVNILSNRDLKIPTTDGEMLEFCEKAHNALKCIREHVNECSKGVAKSLITKVMNDIEEHINGRCDHEESRAEFLKHAQCLTDDSKLEPIRLCSDKHLVMMEKVSDLPKELRLGGSCCSVHSFRHCVMKHLEANCGGDSSDYFNDMINEIAEENSNLICKQYADMDLCDANYDAATWTELKEIIESEDPSWAEKHHSKTIVPIIMKMIQNAKRK